MPGNLLYLTVSQHFSLIVLFYDSFNLFFKLTRFTPTGVLMLCSRCCPNIELEGRAVIRHNDVTQNAMRRNRNNMESFVSNDGKGSDVALICWTKWCSLEKSAV